MRRIARFRQLSPWERQVLLRALVLLPLIALGLRLLGLRRIQALLARASNPAAGADAQSRVKQVAWLVGAAARHGPYRASCLPLSLALQRLLRDAGIGSELRLGVRRTAGSIEAHAWLERDGDPLTETAEFHARYAAFDPAISPPAGISR